MTHTKNYGKFLLLLAFSMVVTLAGEMHAQAQAKSSPARERAKTTELTIFAGASVSRKENTNPFSLQVKTSVPFGGRIAYNFDNHNAVEFTVANPLSFYGNYVYNFSTSRARVVPYLTAGVGGSRHGLELGGDTPGTTNVNVNGQGPDRSQAAFTANFGGGVKYSLTDRIGVRFDARDIVGRYKATFTSVPGAPGGIVNGRRTLNDVQITAGIVFSFGKR
jgi:opacity protein-like surface antigen